MPKPTAAANAAPMPITTRRAFLKAGGALGTVAALAVPVAVLPKAEAAEQQDATLLEMGRELETQWALENKLSAECGRLHDLAEQTRPAPGPELLAYQLDGRFLLERREGGRYRINFGVQDKAADIERCWRILGFREGPCPEVDVLAALERWRAAGREADDLVGATAADEEFERVVGLTGELCDRIVAEPARTPAGLRVKLRALDWCYPDSSHVAAIKEQADDDEEVTSVRLAASTLRDALAILGVGGAHV